MSSISWSGKTNRVLSWTGNIVVLPPQTGLSPPTFQFSQQRWFEIPDWWQEWEAYFEPRSAVLPFGALPLPRQSAQQIESLLAPWFGYHQPRKCLISAESFAPKRMIQWEFGIPESSDSFYSIRQSSVAALTAVIRITDDGSQRVTDDGNSRVVVL